MSDFLTHSLLAEKKADKWDKHAQANDHKSQSMKLPQTKTQAETGEAKSQSMRVCSESISESEKVRGAKTLQRSNLDLSNNSYHSMSGKGLNIMPEAEENERVAKKKLSQTRNASIPANDLEMEAQVRERERKSEQGRKKCENKLSHTTKW